MLLKFLPIFHVLLAVSSTLRISKANYLAYTNELPVKLMLTSNHSVVYIFDAPVEILRPPHLSNIHDVQELTIANARTLREIRAGVFNRSKLKKLKINVSQLSRISKSAFDDMPELIEVSFIYGRITVLSSRWFQNSHNVEELIFSHNLIRSLTKMVFRNVYNVKYLGLDNNRINFVCPHAFVGLNKVEIIDLTNNRIQTIDKMTFVDLPKLASLDLSRNNIKCFYDIVLWSFGRIKEVWLSKNSLNAACFKKLSKHFRNFRLVD